VNHSEKAYIQLLRDAALLVQLEIQFVQFQTRLTELRTDELNGKFDALSDTAFIAMLEEETVRLNGFMHEFSRLERRLKAQRGRNPANIRRIPIRRESEVKAELKELMREMYGDDPLAETFCTGVDNMPEEQAEKILGDLQEYARLMPGVLAEVDALIRRCEART